MCPRSVLTQNLQAKQFWQGHWRSAATESNEQLSKEQEGRRWSLLLSCSRGISEVALADEIGDEIQGEIVVGFCWGPGEECAQLALVNHFSCLLVVTSAVGHCTYYNNSHTPSEAPVFFLCTQKPCQSSSREVVNVVLLLSQFSRAHLCRINSVCALSAAEWAVLVDQSTSEPMRKRFKSLRGKETSRMNVFLFDSFGDS